MNPSHASEGNRNSLRYLPLLGLLLILVGAAVAFYWLRGPRGPELLNRPTKAREVRPFSTEPDPRLDPLPLEEEKHGK